MKPIRPIFRSLPFSSRKISHSALPTRLRPSYASAATLQPRFQITPSSRHAFTSTSRRFESTTPEEPEPGFTITPDSSREAPPGPEVPSYFISFTCRPCSTRSSHYLSKQAYHYGAVLIKCPGCSNRHVMADHLGIFTDKGQGGTLDDILKRYDKGDGLGTLKKGFVEGDLEFWDDGTVQKRKLEEEQSQKDLPQAR